MFVFDITHEDTQPVKKQSPMLIERLPTWSLAIIYGLYIVLIIGAIVIGVMGPDVYDRQSVSSWGCSSASNKTFTTFDPAHCHGADISQGQTWQGQISNLNKLNQQLKLIAEISNVWEEDLGVVKDINFTVSMSGKSSGDKKWNTLLRHSTHSRTVTCHQNTEKCEPVILISEQYLSYSEYQFNISLINLGSLNFVGETVFTYQYVNEDYTVFELWFRFVGLLCAFTGLIVLAVLLRKHTWHLWKTEQKWTVVLLFGAMCYDNPVFPMKILFKGWFFTFVDQLMIVTFVVLLLYYFIVMLDSIRYQAENRGKSDQGRLPHIVKLVLILGIWFTCLAVWSWLAFKDISDPEFTIQQRSLWEKICYSCLGVLLIMYSFYLFYIGVRSMVLIRRGGQKRIQFFMFFTFLVITIAFVGLIIKAYVPTVHNASIFLVSIAIINLYTAMLAIFYIPVGKAYQAVDVDIPSDTTHIEDEAFKESHTDVPMEVIATEQKEKEEEIKEEEPDVITLTYEQS